MKSSFKILVIGILIFGGGIIFYFMDSETPAPEKFTPAITTLTVKNSSKDTVLTYLTLGGCSNCITNVNGIFGITSTGGQGSFLLAPSDSVSYTAPADSAIEGNICFLQPPVNCPNHSTVCEFALNNYSATDTMAQETVEISCVAGVSFIARYTLSGGGIWTATTGYENITSFQNDTIGANSGLVGVFPYGCDDCTQSTRERPSCVDTFETPQKLPICNVSRNASLSGGSVRIEYLKPIGLVPLK